MSTRLQLLNPRSILERGFVWLSDDNQQAITKATQMHEGQSIQATLVDGLVDLKVSGRTLQNQ